MQQLRIFALTLAVFLGVTAAFDAAFVAWFPSLPRVASDFSAAYLQRELSRLAHEPPGIVVTGDSVLWGYKLDVSEAAPTLLHERGFRTENLAFEGGSPANTYALLRALLAAGVHPKLFVFNVNQKEFNPVDSAYRTLHPGLQRVALPFLTPDERALLDLSKTKTGLDARLDDAVSSVWKLYAMRSDLRETLFGDIDAVHSLDKLIKTASGAASREEAAHRPTPDAFEGTYDLTPLDGKNVSVVFLKKIAILLRQNGVPGIALLTPTNHTLLHEYIDAPEYRTNVGYVRRLLSQDGLKVLDYDGSFAAWEFIDNDHLTASGNQHLAALLGSDLRL